MKRGKQEIADFGVEGTLWGYTKHKFGLRATEVAIGFFIAGALSNRLRFVRLSDATLLQISLA
jgi:hypothetical protein